MRLILIRHGQTPSNVLGALDTAHPGPGLTDLGLAQAQALVGSLAGEKIDTMHISTLLRTKITAEPLAESKNLELHTGYGLHEIEAGDLEMRTDHAAVRTYLETLLAWGAGELDARVPGGADGHEFFGRFDADIEEIAGSGADTAAIVSHGAAIRMWVANRSVGFPKDFSTKNPLENTGIVVLEGNTRDGWHLKTWEGSPVGGPELADRDAEDPMGEDQFAEA